MMSRMERVLVAIAVWVSFCVLMGFFLWAMAELFIDTDAMFDALEAALEARQ